MTVPEGALSSDQCVEIKKNHPKTIIYFVGDPILTYEADRYGLIYEADRYGIIKGQANEFMFGRTPPEYYFTNWFLAWGYSLRYKRG